VKGTGILRAYEMDYVAVAGKIIQAFPDILSVQFTSYRVKRIVELPIQKDSFIAGIVRGFRESGGIDVIGRTPGKIGIMCPGFQDIVLEVMMMDQEKTVRFTHISEFPQAFPVPVIIPGQIVFAQSIPGNSLTRPGKRLFIKGSPDLPVHPPDALVVIAPPVVPEPVVVFQCNYMI
jgi:hypothetical protein